VNLRFLGDVHDHWKGSMIDLLLRNNLLEKFKVDPMLTDYSQWGEIDYSLYCKILRIKRSMLIHHSEDLCLSRKTYIDEILSVEGDIFFDPDIGICTNTRPGYEHLKASELYLILNHIPSRIVMVYQHIRARKARERIVEIFDYLQKQGAGINALSYHSASVAMLFLSKDSERYYRFCKYFEQMLDWHSNRLLFQWERPRKKLELIQRI